MAVCQYNLDLASESNAVIGKFSGVFISGYITSGTIVVDSVTAYNGRTSTTRLYVIEDILANTWNYGVTAGAGIVGLGVNSPFLSSFIEPTTNTLTFSVSIQRSSGQPTSQQLPAATTSTSNITFG